MKSDPTVPTVIRIDDDELPNGRRHSLSLTLWTVEQATPDDQVRVARFLAIDFLERTLAAMKLEAPVTEDTYWRAEDPEATVLADAPMRAPQRDGSSPWRPRVAE
jgi:hypothetical protein